MKISLFLLFIFSLSSLSAQSLLSLDDCRHLAIENNKKLKIARQEVIYGEAQKREAFTKYLPSVDISGAYLRNQKKMSLLEEDALLPVGTVGEDGKFTLRPDQILIGSDGNPVINNGQYVPKDFAFLPKDNMTIDARNVGLLQIGLTQPIYIGGKVRAYNEMAGLAEKLARTEESGELQNVILATDEAYWQIVSLHSRMQMVEKYVETMKKLEQNVRMMHETGVATKADLLSVAVKLNEAEMNLTKVEDGLTLSRMALNQICGMPLDSIVNLQEEYMDVDVKVLSSINLEQVYLRRPEIISLEYATKIYKKKERIAFSEYMPNIALTANWVATSPSFFNGISTSLDGMWSVGVGIKVPLIHWGASRKNLRSSRAKTEIIKLKLEEAKEMVALQVRQSEYKIKEVERKLIMTRKNKEQAEENLKFANLGFQEGTIPVINVLEAQTAWLQANSDLIDAQIEARLSEVYLRKAYGVLSVEN